MSSYWSIDEYASSPNYLNYQVWTNSRARSIASVHEIINNVTSKSNHTISKAEKPAVAPELYARKAHYELGKFYLDIHNQLSEPTDVAFDGFYTTLEVDGIQVPFSTEIEILPGQTSVELDVASGNIFDAEINFQAGDSQKDAIYLADGAWGLDFIESSTSIESFEILSDDKEEAIDEYLVERGISVSGTTDSYLSICKQLLAGRRPVDLSGYNTFSFDSRRTGTYEVTLISEGNTDPRLNMSFTLDVEADREVNIPYGLFSNAYGELLDPSDITTIYIAFIKDNNESGDFEFDIENVRFRNLDESNISVGTESLTVYPNPARDNISLTHFFDNSSDVMITVYDTRGSLVYQMNTTAYKGLQKFDVDLKGNASGLYVVNLKHILRRLCYLISGSMLLIYLLQ